MRDRHETVFIVSTKERARATLEVFGWPPILSTSRAAAYVDRTRWTLYRAIAAGELAIAGRRARTLLFRRDELERWLLGSTGAPATSPRAPKRIRSARPASDATTRLRALKKLRVH